MEPDSNSSFGIYIHWPYCASKCPYCDFNSHVSDSVDQAVWRAAYEQEIKYYADLTSGRMVTSIFFGGGTPSLMEPETVNSVISSIAGYWPLAEDIEITLEANPTSVEAGKFADFHSAGVNRLSLGIQSLKDDDLHFLGRKHSAKEALKALEIASGTFDRYSFDLIYARPDQNVKDWREELGEALQFADGHLSLYQLTIEPGTPFYLQHKRNEFSIPGEDKAADLFEATQEIMDKAGMPAYEVSNHASEGQESKHNLTYWHYDDYVGIGPGAHGRITIDGAKKATRGRRAPDIWLQHVQKEGHGAHPFEEIKPEQRFTETLMMGLRLRDGVKLSCLEVASGKPLSEMLDMAKIKYLEEENLLLANGTVLQVTAAGMLRLNAILGYLL